MYRNASYAALALLVVAYATVPAAAGTAAEQRAEGADALHAKDYERAVTALEALVETAPDDTDAWVSLGMARSGLNEWDSALKAYMRAIDLDPDSARIRNNVANVYFRRGDFVSAAPAYARALELDPGYLLAAFHYGWVLRQLNRVEEAEAAFEHCLKLSAANDRERKTLVDCRFGLGSMRHRAGDYAAAARLLEEVILVHPQHPEARYLLGMAYRNLDRPDEAKIQFEIHAKLMRARRSTNTYIESPDEP
jgi:tetratricopeptide (TPR) repeat protein